MYFSIGRGLFNRNLCFLYLVFLPRIEYITIVFKDYSILKFDFNFDRLFLKEKSLHVFFLIESDSFHGSFHVTMNMSNEYNFKQRFNFY